MQLLLVHQSRQPLRDRDQRKPVRKEIVALPKTKIPRVRRKLVIRTTVGLSLNQVNHAAENMRGRSWTNPQSRKRKNQRQKVVLVITQPRNTSPDVTTRQRIQAIIKVVTNEDQDRPEVVEVHQIEGNSLRIRVYLICFVH